MSYYNTTHLSGGDLKEAQKAAKTQEEWITDLFDDRGTSILSPSMILNKIEYIGFKWPITSIRRAITNLTNEGKLIKTNIQVKGLYGKREYCWRLRTKAEQQKLFV